MVKKLIYEWKNFFAFLITTLSKKEYIFESADEYYTLRLDQKGYPIDIMIGGVLYLGKSSDLEVDVQKFIQYLLLHGEVKKYRQLKKHLNKKYQEAIEELLRTGKCKERKKITYCAVNLF